LKNSQALAEAFKKESFRIITNGTDNHLFVWDIRNTLVNERLSAAKFEKVLDFCGISTNKNYIPSDSSMKPHGIRIGLLAMTSRGMKETDMAQIAKFFMQVYQLLRHFPLSAKDQKLQDFIFDLHKNEEYEFIRHELQKIKEQIELFVESYEIPGQSYLQD
jgi:glycine hydroxymethyltransferase